jgi:HEAT repeat protein
VLDTPEGVDVLIRLLADDSVDVRIAAAGAVGNSAGARVVPSLLRLIDDEEVEPYVVAAAFRNVGPAAVDPLVGRLGGGSMSARAADAVLSALGEIADTRATPAVLSFFATQDSEEMRAHAVRTLGALRDPAAVPALVRAVDDAETDPALLETTLESLGQIADARATPSIAALLDRGDDSLRALAAGALARIRGDAADEALRAAATREDLAVVAGAYTFFLSEGGFDDILVSALEARGGQSMAISFLNSGRSTLESAARAWAEANGYIIYYQPTFRY